MKEEILNIISQSPEYMHKTLLHMFISSAYIIKKKNIKFNNGCINTWQDLYEFMNNIISGCDKNDLINITKELLNIGEQIKAPEEVFAESADILGQYLKADLVVCRTRNIKKQWKIINSHPYRDIHYSPLFLYTIDEELQKHPVMNAICNGKRHIISKNLRGFEMGGESIDCAAYSSGYRTRLALILRENKHKPPYGMLLFYSKDIHAFDYFNPFFLDESARIVSLTVSRRMSLVSDAIEKAAGAVAHHGNNALAIMKNYLELCLEEMENGEKIDEKELIERINQTLRALKRIHKIIENLGKAAKKPKLEHYVAGSYILDINDNT